MNGYMLSVCEFYNPRVIRIYFSGRTTEYFSTYYKLIDFYLPIWNVCYVIIKLLCHRKLAFLGYFDYTQPVGS